MYKEILIIIVVVALIVTLDIVSNNYTKIAVEELSIKLNDLREELLKENQENCINKIENIKMLWKDKYNILAYYIEHDELEKVETELTRLNADIEMKEYKHCINELDTTIFILNHIGQKEEFNIINIF